MLGITHQLLHYALVTVWMFHEPFVDCSEKIILRRATLTDCGAILMSQDDTRSVSLTGDLIHAEVKQLMCQLMLVHSLAVADP